MNTSDFMFSPRVLLYMLDWSETDSTMIKSRCPSLLKSCRVFWASCSRFRFWFNWSVWFWRDEMRTAADVSTCCMNPASSTSKQRRSSPNSFLTTHFNTSDSFWLDRERQLRSLPSIGWPLQQKQILFSHSKSEPDILRETVMNWAHHDVVRQTEHTCSSSVVHCESYEGLKEFQTLFNFQHTYSQLFFTSYVSVTLLCYLIKMYHGY